MTRRTIRNIIILATVLLIGLVASQIFWIRKAYDINEKQFNHDVTYALKNVVRQILVHNKDSSIIADPVSQISPNYFRVSLNDTLHPFYLESLLKNEFLKQEINTTFEYSIYDCFTDEVAYVNSVFLEEDHAETPPQSPDFAWKNDAHYFGVFFPEKGKHLISRMKFWFGSTIVLLFVAIFFAYTISVMLKQKRLSEIQRDFINNMTHELKTPISTISLSSDVLLSAKIIEQPERFKKYAEIIKSENRRLKTLADRVLQIGSIDNHEISLKKDGINLHKLITNVVNGFEVILNNHNGKITMNLNATNSMIVGDEVHLTNVFSNLIDNAIKYCTQEPNIAIETKNEQNKFIIEFIDNGIGIKREYQKYVFDKFYRVHTGDRHDVKGFGLGLHYVSAILKAHKGTISIYSKLNEGSTFSLAIPNNHE